MQGNSIPADAEAAWEATLEPWLRAQLGKQDALLLLLDNAEELAASYKDEAQVCGPQSVCWMSAGDHQQMAWG